SGTHATTNTHGDHAVAPVAAFEFVEDLHGELGSGAAEWVSQRDRSTIDVDFFFIEFERANNGKGLRGKSFVEFDQVDIVDGEACHFECFWYSGNRADAHDFGWYACYGK